MRSILLHKYEKQLDNLVCIVLLSMLGFELIEGWMSISRDLKQALWAFCYILCATLSLHLYFRFKYWKKEGFNLSRRIGLRRIVIFKTNLVNQRNEEFYEIHHHPFPVSYGFRLRKTSRQKLIKEMNEELQKDFIELAYWAERNNAAFISVTHRKMAHLWSRSAESHFYIEPINKLVDPYVVPSLIRWWVMSFATTGRIVSLPKEWETILFLKK